jgi:hypothetical protein
MKKEFFELMRRLSILNSISDVEISIKLFVITYLEAKFKDQDITIKEVLSKLKGSNDDDVKKELDQFNH